VTGGFGFVGSHLVDELIRLQKHVIIIDRPRHDPPAYTPPDGVELRLADIRQPGEVADALRDVEVIFHTAANASGTLSVTDPRFDFETNARGTFNMAEAALASNVQRFVYISSASVYGIPQRFPMDEEHPRRPFVPYGATKLMGELASLSFFHSAGLPVVIGRPFCVYGRRENPRLALVEPARYLRWHLNHKPIQIVGDINKKTRDFVHVTDLVRGLLILADRAPAGEYFNIGSGEEITMKDLAEAIGEATGRDAEIEDFPEVTEDTYRLVGDIAKIRALGYEPQRELVEALREMSEELGEYPELPSGPTIFKRGQKGEQLLREETAVL
jgi:nucleoside-diphosphate-sugar epimerase